MARALRSLTTTVGRHPVVTIVLALLVTGALASRIPEAELTNDTAAFSPVTEQVLASEELQDRFTGAATASLQVVVTGNDVVSPEGAATVAVVEDLVTERFGDALAGDRAVVSFLTPARSVAERQGIDLAATDDATVDMLQQRGLQGPPPGQSPPGQAPAGDQGPDVGALAAALTAGDDPVASDAGLVLVQLDRSAFADESALVAAQTGFSDALLATETPLDAVPFSFEVISSPDEDFQAEVGQLFGMAAAVILVVLAFVLRARRGTRLGWFGAIRRSLADMVAAIGTVILAVVWVQGLTVVLGPGYLGLVGQPSPPTQIIPVLLLALGVDYAIHLTSRYREELDAGAEGPRRAVARLGPTVGIALLLSMVTTAVGFLTNLASPIPAIQDLGVLAAAGILSAFVLCVTFLPAIRALLDRRPADRDELVVDEVAPRDDSLFARIALVGLRPALRAPVVMLAAAALLAGGGAYGLTQLQTEFDFTIFLPDDSPYRGAIEVLDEDFGGGLAEVTEVLVTPDGLDAEQHNTYVEVADRLAGAAGVVELAGGADVTTPVTELAAAVPAGPEQEAAVAQARDAGLQEDGTVAAGADVATVYAVMASAFPSVAAVVDADTPDSAARIAVRTQSDDVGVDTVAATMDEALAPLRAAGADAVVTSQALITDDITNSLRNSQVQGLGITVVAVMLLLGLVYGVRDRRPGLGVLVMLPVTAVVLWTFGLMAATGIPFDPVTAVISALVVGLGVDFCIHLGERFVEDVEEHRGDIAGALRASLQHTGAALAGSAATTMFGFSVLSTASIVPFQRLGTVTIYAVGLSLLATLFVLPSVLVLYGRRHLGSDRAADHVAGGTVVRA